MQEHKYNRDIELEVFDRMFRMLNEYVREGYAREAFRATSYIMASNIRTVANTWNENLEQTMEGYFDLIAETIYNSMKDDEEEEEDS